MATIASSIKLVDNMTPVMTSMLKGMNLVVSTFENMDKASQNCIDIKSLAAARTEMNNAAVAAKNFEKSLADAENKQSKMNASIVDTTNASSFMIAKIAAIPAALAAASFACIKAAADMETTTVAFTTMLGSADKANSMLGNLKNFAATTPFEFTEVAAAAKSLLAFGINAEDVTSTLTSLGDVSSGISAPIGEIAEIYGKARVQGRLFAEDINQLTGRGIPIIQQLAKQFGVAEEQVKNLVEKGEVGFGNLEQAFKDMTKEGSQFGGLMKAQSATLNGQWSNLMDNIGQSSVIVGNALVEAFNIKGAISGAVSALGGLTSALQGQEFQDFVDNVGTNFAIAETNFETAWAAFVGKIEADTPKISGNFTGLQESWNTFFSTMTGDLDGFDWGEFGNGMGTLFEIWAQVETGGASVVLSVGSFVNSIVGFWDALFNLGNGEGPDWTGMVDSLNGYIQSIRGALVGLISIFSGKEKANEIVGEWFTIGGGSGEAYAGGIQRSEGVMTAAVQSATDKAIAPMTTLPTTTGALGQQLGNSFAGGLINSQAVVTSGAQAISDNTKAPLTLLPGFMANQGSLGAGNLANSLTNGAPAVNVAAIGLQDSAVIALNPLPGNLKNIGAGATAELGAAITSQQPSVESSAQAVHDGIVGRINPIVPFGQSTGENLGIGLSIGLDSKKGEIEASSGSVIDLVINKFMSGFNMHSPSKLSEEWGFNVIEGWINGLDGDRLVAFVDSIIAMIKNAADNGSFNLKAGIEFLGNGAAELFKSLGLGGAAFGDLVTPVAGGVTSGFGYRDAFMTDSGQMSSSYHEGIDIGAGYGEAVGAAGAGTVTMAGWNGGYGNTVMIDHGNGLSSMYAHLSSILVSVGDIVSKLQTIGLVGSTGNSTGAHLHFGLYQDGAAIDPSALFGGYASGTKYATRGLHLVGENGPEIMSFAGGEKVLDADKSKAILSGAGKQKAGGSNKALAPIINITMGDNIISSEVDAKKVIKIMRDELEEQLAISVKQAM